MATVVKRPSGLKVFQPPQVRNPKIAILGFPVVKADIRHAVLAVQLGNSRTGCIFLKGRDNLLFGKP